MPLFARIFSELRGSDPDWDVGNEGMYVIG